ncbi:serine/threonine-protein kinase [Reticulomyxa filosa]|uniref:non-specific serine/threonine protein kinase n=1 Tax=Reticulomyxa filosa TaxID=46433 RepID=X6NXY2_RETFI|nr:serine/threonine-protein kinase [Reticulomyxa filosa]|eukprot:ETO30142.1 serine/threonine-protein kinase [Reticulomyxa filosa]
MIVEKNIIRMNRFQNLSTLGDGTYGTVLKAVNRSNGEVVAIKRMKRKYYSWKECIRLREIRSLKKLNHPNIIKLKEVIREQNVLYFVFEFMEKNVYEMMKEQQQSKHRGFDEPTIMSIMFQCLTALGASTNKKKFAFLLSEFLLETNLEKNFVI